MKSCNYLAVGLTTLDILGRNIEHIPQTNATTIIKQMEVIPAGTAAEAAMVAATLGMRTTLISSVGRDRQGGFVTQELEAMGGAKELTCIEIEAVQSRFSSYGQ